MTVIAKTSRSDSKREKSRGKIRLKGTGIIAESFTVSRKHIQTDP